jgi:antitoxin ParD1/3/4
MPTMNVSLTDEMAKYVEAEVASGDYVSASEVVRDALRTLKHAREMEEEELRILREEVRLGIEAADRGEFSDRTLDEIYQAALREAGY